MARVVQQITPQVGRDLSAPCHGLLGPFLGQERLLVQIYDWDFNVFDLERRSGHRPLFAVVLALLEDQGLLVRT